MKKSRKIHTHQTGVARGRQIKKLDGEVSSAHDFHTELDKTVSLPSSPSRKRRKTSRAFHVKDKNHSDISVNNYELNILISERQNSVRNSKQNNHIKNVNNEQAKMNCNFQESSHEIVGLGYSKHKKQNNVNFNALKMRKNISSESSSSMQTKTTHNMQVDDINPYGLSEKEMKKEPPVRSFHRTKLAVNKRISRNGSVRKKSFCAAQKINNFENNRCSKISTSKKIIDNLKSNQLTKDTHLAIPSFSEGRRNNEEVTSTNVGIFFKSKKSSGKLIQNNQTAENAAKHMQSGNISSTYPTNSGGKYISKPETENFLKGNKRHSSVKKKQNNVSKSKISSEKKKIDESPFSNGQRKSSRQRFPVLAHWRSQRPRFGTSESGDPIFLGIDEGTEEDLSSQKCIVMMRKPRKLKNKLMQTYQDDTSEKQTIDKSVSYKKRCFQKYQNKSTQKYQSERVMNYQNEKMHAKKGAKEYENVCELENQNEGTAEDGCVGLIKPFSSLTWMHIGEYALSKYFTSSSVSFGYLDIPPHKKKPFQYLPDENICFIVIKGEIHVQIQEKEFLAKELTSFIVPSSSAYSLSNISNTKALLSYTIFEFPYVKEH